MSHEPDKDTTPPKPRPQPAQSAPQEPSSPSSAPRPGAPYYTPPPALRPPAAKSRSPVRSPLALLLLGLVAGGALAWGGWHLVGMPPATGPIAPPTKEATIETTLALANADVDAQATETLKKLLAGGSSGLPDELGAANAETLRGLATNSPTVAEEVQSGKRVLYRLHLLDFLVQDADEVELFVDGARFGRIPLSNAGTEVLIPLAQGSTARMKVVATADGGGGVTFGTISSQGEARTRVMQVGESEQWQITIR